MALTWLSNNPALLLSTKKIETPPQEISQKIPTALTCALNNRAGLLEKQVRAYRKFQEKS